MDDYAAASAGHNGHTSEGASRGVAGGSGQQQHHALPPIGFAPAQQDPSPNESHDGNGGGGGNANGSGGRNGTGETPPRSDVDEILRKKRKAREYKACYPCRQRKVKCDQTVPCKTCVAREHPELCTYHPPSESHPPAKRHNSGRPSFDAGPGESSFVQVPRSEWDRICSQLVTAERVLSDLRRSIGVTPQAFSGNDSDDYASMGAHATPSRPVFDPIARHMSTEGIHTRNELTGETVHIGGSSVPALVLALGRGDNDTPQVQEVLGKSILPIFGLDNESATYPFVDLWSLPHGSIMKVNELCRALPTDQECLSFFGIYKDHPGVVFPAIADIAQFESDLLQFLINRASLQPNENGDHGISEQMVYGKSITWLGLLFAALASGCQSSNLARRDRELTSQVFVCCSFECLRFTNFLSSPNLEVIQTLLVLGNVISNNMNAGVAWSLLGLTIRLGQSLGLHRACPQNTSPETKTVRSKTWWSIIWQDSLLSITYDRASSSTCLDSPSHFPPNTNSGPGNRSYAECMWRLCRTGLEIVRERATVSGSSEALQRITEHRRELQEIMSEASDYLKDSRRCRSMRDQLEHWALYMHISYMMSELCRPAISPSTAGYDLTKTLRKTCIDSLANTVEAFLGLQNVTPFANRSWAALHRSISSALLLGILGEPARNERARNLLSKLIHVLSDVTSSLDPQEMSAPVKRSIAALRKLTTQQQQQQQEPMQGPTPRTTSTLSGSPSQDGAGDFSFLDGFNFDENALSPILTMDKDSPYALMDSIMWGVKKTPQMT
ncbi:hypothetical protein K402DRAFT_394470 [Aulographum hederae CBS 113979]|uniref:Zn(2)-C6 fungal-type domain-containing protein n=1 Tax=Aulographum hederae CBS 113979 TaxID=1176131 RepID=A0A6G1GYM5_9PEZI|nr:hypothetical protein K402DRAFT_394470 [Aulographum hederae CBS 113979]